MFKKEFNNIKVVVLLQVMFSEGSSFPIEFWLTDILRLSIISLKLAGAISVYSCTDQRIEIKIKLKIIGLTYAKWVRP